MKQGNMSEQQQIKWRIAGEEFSSCNCNWGCPCQFNALPTTGRCEAFVTCLITDGYFANTRLDGVVFSRIYWWPRAIHEGNGVRRMIIDEQTAKEQRDALIAIESGQHGGLIWEISAAVAPRSMETLFAPISFKVDREKRRSDPQYWRDQHRANQKPSNRRGAQGTHCLARWFRIQGGGNGEHSILSRRRWRGTGV